MSMKKRVIRAAAAAAFIAGILPMLGAASARAQSDPSVTVDLSVINDLGRSSGATSAIPGGAGAYGLRVPGPQHPKSRLHVAPARGGSADPETVTIGGSDKAPPAAKKSTRAQTSVAKPRQRTAGTEKPKPAASAAAPAPRPAPAAPPESHGPATPSPAAPVAAAAATAPAAPAAPAAATAALPPTAPQLAPGPAAPAAPEPARDVAALTPPTAPSVAKPDARAPALKPAALPPAPAVAAPPVVSPPAAAPSATPAAPARKGTELASRSNAAARGPLKEGDALSIRFDGESDKMPDSARAEIDRVIAAFNDQPDLRMRLFGYAGGPALTSSKARRLSLSRALDVRAYLMKQGVRSTRIDVRALGDRVDNEPLNRVDVTIVDR